MSVLAGKHSKVVGVDRQVSGAWPFQLCSKPQEAIASWLCKRNVPHIEAGSGCRWFSGPALALLAKTGAQRSVDYLHGLADAQLQEAGQIIARVRV